MLSRAEWDSTERERIMEEFKRCSHCGQDIPIFAAWEMYKDHINGECKQIYVSKARR